MQKIVTRRRRIRSTLRRPWRSKQRGRCRWTSCRRSWAGRRSPSWSGWSLSALSSPQDPPSFVNINTNKKLIIRKGCWCWLLLWIDTLAGAAPLFSQKETHDITTIRLEGMYTWNYQHCHCPYHSNVSWRHHLWLNLGPNKASNDQSEAAWANS